MKKLSFVLLLLASAFEEADAQSMLKVSLRDNTTQISVSVDGRHFTKRGTSVTVGELPFGRHFLKIYRLNFNRRGRGYEEVIYDGEVKTYNGIISLLVFDPVTGTREVNEREIEEYLVNHPITGRGKFEAGNRGEFDSRYNNSNTDNSSSGNTSGQYSNQQNTAPANTYSNQPARPVASPVSADQLGTLTESKTDKIKKKVAAKNTDTQKMTLLKDELKGEKLTTNQVADMTDWFMFESSKLEFAKWAYSITADKEYFSDLLNKFSYKNSQDELDKFIKDQK